MVLQICKRVFAAVLLLLLVPVVSFAQLPPVESFRLDLNPDEIRDGEAKQVRSVAMQAYLYQLPAFLQMRQVPEFLQGRALLSPDETALGGWVLVREPSTPKTDNTMPNADTLYGASYVWLDRQGPVVVTLPAVKQRYYSVVMHDTFFNCFGILSPRTVGDDGGNYLIVPPTWNGEKPTGVEQIFIAPTPIVALYQRVYLGQDRSDLPAARQIQDQITLTPLAAWGKAERRFPSVDDNALRVPKLRELSDPIEYFDRTNVYAALSPPPAADAPLLNLFKTVGIGPGQTLPADAHVRQAINDGVADAQAALNARISSGPFERGWRVPDPKTAMFDQDILSRAAVQITQIASLPNEEAMYFVGTRDASNSLFDGKHQYRLTFSGNQLPPVSDGAFWSITMYDGRSLLVENPIHRYLIRPDTEGLTFAQDGSLTLAIQAEEPRDTPHGNWLPAPRGAFIIVLRAYWPKKEMLDGTWFPPSVERIGSKDLDSEQSSENDTDSSANPLVPLAKAAAVQAFVYATAPNGMYQRLSDEVLNPKTRVTGFDEFRHFDALATPDVAPFRAPNNDTLYSTAWLDLRSEPVVLKTPNTGGRYWTAQVLDFDSNTLTNFGARIDGTAGGSFAVVGPDWTAELPVGVNRSVKCPTRFASVLLRVLVDGPKDVPAAAVLQKSFSLGALSQWNKGQAGPATNDIDGIALYQGDTPAQRLTMLDHLLKMNPVRPGEESLMAQFASLDIGPSKVQHVMKLDANALLQADAESNAAIAAAGLNSGDIVNGWQVMSRGIGVYGHDYLQRAAVWAGGPLANVPEESLYPSAVYDSEGKMLDGSTGRYKLTFAAGQLPPVDFFWSITMYQTSNGMLVKNSIDRYSIGNRTDGLKFNEDGSLTIVVQKGLPGRNESNWLPAPDGPFYMSMRLYGPRPAALSGEWKPPAILRVP